MISLDALPEKFLNHLWPYLVKNEDNLAVASTCSSLYVAECAFLESNMNELFSDARFDAKLAYGGTSENERSKDQKRSVIYFAIWQKAFTVKHPLLGISLTRSLFYRINDEIRKVIRSCQIDLPKHRVLLAGDVRRCDKTNEEECDLMELFKNIIFSRFSRNAPIRESAEDDDMTIPEIRNWMKENRKFCESFTELDLSVRNIVFHDLTSLPKEIGLFVNLERLYLEGNKLTGLCPEVEKLSKLRILHLTNNPFPEFPPKIGQLIHQGDGVYHRKFRSAF